MTSFFLPVPAVRGGASEKAWYGLAKLFAVQGHDVTLISRSWPNLPARETESGISHVRVAGFDHSPSLRMNLFLDLVFGIRAAVAMPESDAVILNAVALPAWLGVLKRSAGKVAVMMGRAPKGQVRFYRRVERIYAPSSFIAAKILEPWAAARTRVIGYPIDWNLHAECAAQTGEPVTIGFVGRLHPEKGVGLLVEAACLLAGRTDLPAWRLRIVGPTAVADGGGGTPWVEGLKARAAELGPRIEWLGSEFDPERLAKLYGSLDIFCYPSLADKGETFGVAIAEAMAARAAVVVSALGCFSDLVTEGATGLIFDHAAPDAAQQLADCVARLIADKGLRGELARRGQAHARRFDYPEVAGTILADLALLTGTPSKNLP